MSSLKLNKLKPIVFTTFHSLHHINTNQMYDALRRAQYAYHIKNYYMVVLCLKYKYILPLHRIKRVGIKYKSICSTIKLLEIAAI